VQIIDVPIGLSGDGGRAKASQVISQHSMTTPQRLDLRIPQAAVKTKPVQQDDGRPAPDLLEAESATGYIDEAHFSTAALNIGRM
jgi:hypothetical protein